MLSLILLTVLGGGSLAMDSRFSMQMNKTVTVQEGLCVFVPCSLSYPREQWTVDTPAYGYWFKHSQWFGITTELPVATNNQSQNVQGDAQGRFELVGSPQNKDCSLLIRQARWSDRAYYYFRIERGTYVRYNFKDVMFSLNVIETRQMASHVSVLTLTPRPEDHGTDLTCRVHFRKGLSTENTIQLNVAYAPKGLSISVSKVKGSALEPQGDQPCLEAQRGQFLRLLCAADSRPPATLSWALEDRVVSWSQTSASGGLELVLPEVKPEDAGRYTCRAENRLGFLNRTLDLSVQYAPERLRVVVSQANRTVTEHLGNGNGTPLPVLEGQDLRLLCVAHSNPPALLSWAQGGQTLHPSQPSDPGVLELPQIQREHEGEVTCHAQNPLGSQRASLTLLVVYKKEATSGGVSNGAIVGAGISALSFCLCLILVIMKTLRKKQTQAETGTQAETQRPRPTRRSTILDYVNVVPGTRHLAWSWKAKRESRSRTPPTDVNSLQLKDNQKRCHASHGSPGPRSSHQAPESRNEQEELHYAALNFPGLRPWETQESKDAGSEYAEIRFH
uniref:Sialic acid binding Ig like lectin 10 n=1 Tax=Rousettus aegyptiacus TaxID=9407 RepID=A0A7J8CLE7_ROUAE|nr:sialic acid binding Ig like lectin 10 [Rousettus aegyptiacus]